MLSVQRAVESLESLNSQEMAAAPRAPKGTVMDAKCCKRHCRTKCWPRTARSLTHAEQRTRFSLSLTLQLSTSRRVYRRCPEYLTGGRAHPWDFICTGVHLVGAVCDYLHIVSHLHPAFLENGTLTVGGARGTDRPLHGGARGIVCRRCSEDRREFVLIRTAANAAQLCKDLTCL